MALRALNDLAKIKLDKDEFGLGEAKGTAEGGVLVALPDKFNYFGMWSFAFEKSFMNEEALEKLYKYWELRIGNRVYWTALSEKGNIIEKDGDRFAFIKLTSLIADDDDPNSNAHNIHGDGAGSFAI